MLARSHIRYVPTASVLSATGVSLSPSSTKGGDDDDLLGDVFDARSSADGDIKGSVENPLDGPASLKSAAEPENITATTEALKNEDVTSSNNDNQHSTSSSSSHNDDDGNSGSSSSGGASSTVNTCTDSGNPNKQWACDICANIAFDNETLLDAHMQARHPGLCSQYQEFQKVCEEKVRPVWQEIQEKAGDRWVKWGEKCFEVASQRDGGAEKIAEAHAARAQLEVLVQRWIPDAKVFVFGSSVVMGVWDGLSDIDYMVVNVNDMERGIWPPNEKNAVRALTELLKRAGFKYSNLEPVQHARVPIIKHHAAVPLFNTVSQEAEDVISRTSRWTFTQPLQTQDRVRFEAGLRESVSEFAQQQLRNAATSIAAANDALKSSTSQADEAFRREKLKTLKEDQEDKRASYENPILQLWWHSEFTSCSATFATTTIAVKAICHSPCVTPNLLRRVGPLHDDFQPELFKLDFDLGFRPFGVRNSFLLRNYLNGHPCARPGAIVLKDWSKISGVNNSIGGYYTSYAVNIMWIYYLVRKGVVPYIDPASVPKSLVGCTDYNPLYVPIVPPDIEVDEVKRKAMFGEMGRLLAGFFAFYAFEFNWNEHVVTLNRSGEPTAKEDLQWHDGTVVQGKKSTRYLQCIEDPYEDNLNLGRHIGDGRRWKVLQEIYRGLISLIKDPYDRSCVFSGTASEQQLQQAATAAAAAVPGADGETPAGEAPPAPKVSEELGSDFRPLSAISKDGAAADGTSASGHLPGPTTQDMLLLTGLSVKCVEASVEGYVTEQQLRDYINSYRDELDEEDDAVKGVPAAVEGAPSMGGRGKMALQRALSTLRWSDVIRRVGYKQIGGRVYARRMIGARGGKKGGDDKDGNGDASSKGGADGEGKRDAQDLSEQLLHSSTAAALDRPLNAPPEWVLWTPPTYPSPSQRPVGDSGNPHHFAGYREACSARVSEMAEAARGGLIAPTTLIATSGVRDGAVMMRPFVLPTQYPSAAFGSSSSSRRGFSTSAFIRVAIRRH